MAPYVAGKSDASQRLTDKQCVEDRYPTRKRKFANR